MNKPVDRKMVTFKRAKRLMAFLLLACQSIDAAQNPHDEAKLFAEQLQGSGYLDQTNLINTMQQACGQKPENQHSQTQACELKTLFEGHYDSGDKEDVLKSHFAKKNNEAAQPKHPNQPTRFDAEQLLKQKHRFQIASDSPVFKKYQSITETVEEDKTEGEALAFEKGPTLLEAKSPEDKIIRCRKGVSPELRTCVKKLVVKALPQADLIKNVTAYFTARCYNLVTFGINLKTGKINVSQCENSGPTNLSVDNPIGEPDYPDRTTIELISKDHKGEGGVDFRAGGMNPTYANGFTGSFTAFQPHTGRKKSHENNKNNVRGGSYTWKVTMPQKPLLEEYWVGCEDLEHLQDEKTCEEVFSEQADVNATRAISGYAEPVTRPHWSENKEFLCGGGRDIDECEPLIQQKCEQIDSKCAVLDDKNCIEYENTFRCNVSDYQKTDGLSFKAGTLSFLPGTGQSATQGYDAADFGEAVTGFSALTEMGKTLEDGLGGMIGDPNDPTVFQGQCRQCRINLGSFVRDCCKLKGVLQGLLGKCNDEEKKLAMAAVKNKRCLKIEGRYCHKKIAKVCVEKRDSYCCYGSQLAKILHEIAHQQLGLSMGDAEHPVCNGLTASQLSQLNFDTPFAQQKLAEILGEVQASAQEKFNRVQEVVSKAKSLQIKAGDWEKKEAEIEREVKHRAERQMQLNTKPEQKQ